MRLPVTGKQLDELIAAIRLIAEGTVSRPAGLEGVGIAIAGDGLDEPLGPALRETLGEFSERMHEAVRAVASALEDVAEAIHVHAETVAPRAPGVEPSIFVTRAVERMTRRVKFELQREAERRAREAARAAEPEPEPLGPPFGLPPSAFVSRE